MASIPDSLEFLQLRDIGLDAREAEDQASEELGVAQKAAVGMIDEDPTGMTTDLLMIHSKEPWGSPHGEGTGAAIAICNGLNAGHCTEAAEVVKHRIRRPGKRAAPGDPDYVDDDQGILTQQIRPKSLAQQKDPVTTESGTSE